MDTVLRLNVLEHIEEDLAGLRHIHSALLDGSRACILVPEGQSTFRSFEKNLDAHVGTQNSNSASGLSRLGSLWRPCPTPTGLHDQYGG